MQSMRIKTNRRTQMVDITNEVQRVVSALGIKSGTCLLYVPHTTAGVLINEHADPDVASDAEGALDRLIPTAGPYRHAEGNSDSHVKTMLGGDECLRLRRRRKTGARALAGNLFGRI